MKLVAATALALTVGSAHAQDTVYNLNFSAGGEQVTGTMTLSGDSSGPVSSSNIVSYEFGSALGSPVYFNAIDTKSGCMTVGCGLMVVGNSLVWNPPYIPQGTENLAGISGMTLYDGNGGSGVQGQTLTVNFQGPGGGPAGCFSCGGLILVNGNVDPTDQHGGGTSGSLGLSFGEVLGTAANTTAAPEIGPAGAGVALTLLAGTMAALCGRRRAPRA